MPQSRANENFAWLICLFSSSILIFIRVGIGNGTDIGFGVNHGCVGTQKPSKSAVTLAIWQLKFMIIDEFERWKHITNIIY